MRPSQILKSESLVGKVQTILDMNKLLEVGYKLAGEFKECRLFTTSIPFQAAITLNNYETFSKALKKVTIKKNNKVKVIKVNRNIINILLSFTNKSGKSINFEGAL